MVGIQSTRLHSETLSQNKIKNIQYSEKKNNVE
jgi:hypothetical protein